MSVRAYKLIEIKHAKEPTFNCWHDDYIFELSQSSDYNENGGFVSFERETIQNALDEITGDLTSETSEDDKKTIEENEKNKEILENILKDMGDDNDWIDYYCF